jgi:large subunit ribosomal protein L24
MKKIEKKFTAKLKIKKGDTVVVISGADKGTQGSVLEVLPSLNKAVVENVRVVKKHKKPTQTEPGGIVEMNAPVHISNLMLVDPKAGKPTRVGRKVVDGKVIRYSKKSGEIIK